MSGLAKTFGLSPEEFGENLQDNYAKHDVPEETREFEDVAAEYMNDKINTKVTKFAQELILFPQRNINFLVLKGTVSVISSDT